MTVQCLEEGGRWQLGLESRWKKSRRKKQRGKRNARSVKLERDAADSYIVMVNRGKASTQKPAKTSEGG